MYLRSFVTRFRMLASTMVACFMRVGAQEVSCECVSPLSMFIRPLSISVLFNYQSELRHLTQVHHDGGIVWYTLMVLRIAIAV